MLADRELRDQKRCYLCGGIELNKRPGSVRDNSELKMLECTSCGLVFLSSFDHIKSGFYENSAMHGEKVPDLQTLLKETARDDERRFKYLRDLLPGRSLLDFGCGVGGFLLKARELVETAHGVEIEARLSRYYESLGLRVFRDLSHITGNVGKYDIITMFHVLEHIPDPKAILGELSEKLADNGQIIIEVPNADDALLTLYNCESFSHFTYWSCHLFLFTAKTLKMLFTQAGLKANYIKQIQRYPLSNHLYWLSTGNPGGHQKWYFLNSPDIEAAYEKQLASIGKCDTVIASFSR